MEPKDSSTSDAGPSSNVGSVISMDTVKIDASMGSDMFDHPVDLTPYESKPEERRPFKRLPTDRRYIVNFPGYLTMLSESGVPQPTIKHAFGRTILKMDDPILWMINNNLPFEDFTALVRYMNQEVRFDAVWAEPRRYWRFTKLVLKKVPLRIPSHKLIPDKLLHRAVIHTPTWCTGKVTSIPFHDAAIAFVGDLPVYVPIDSFITDEVMSSKWSTVHMFLKDGVSVAMRVTQDKDGLIRADQCWESGVPTGEKVDLVSYMAKWQSSEKFTRGVLNRKEGALYVLVRGEFLPFLRDKIFKDGEVATDGQLIAGIGFPVTCIYQPGQVVYAWLGAFEPWEVIQDKLRVPEGLVILRNHYDAVVEEFPLPGYVLCRMGLVPILMGVLGPLDVVERDYNRGDVVALCVDHERVVEGGCCLVGKPILTYYNARLLLNFRGTVTSLETPLCCIKTDDGLFDVNFEWNAVRPFNVRGTDVVNYFKWAREYVKVGTKVRFNAIAPDFLRRPYCVEVFIEFEPCDP